jgi:hypothetical protein
MSTSNNVITQNISTQDVIDLIDQYSTNFPYDTASTPISGDSLVYNSSTGLYEPVLLPPSGVSSVSASLPLLSSAGSNPNISINTVGVSTNDILTFNGTNWINTPNTTTPWTNSTTSGIGANTWENGDSIQLNSNAFIDSYGNSTFQTISLIGETPAISPSSANNMTQYYDSGT